MRWIEATDQQRSAIVARAAKETEAKRRKPEFQISLRNYIDDLERQIAAKQAELDAGGHERRLRRQMEDLKADLAFQKNEIR